MALNLKNIFGQKDESEEEIIETEEYEDTEEEELEDEYEDGDKAIEIRVVRPKRFDEAPEIADYLLNGRLVFLNLESTDKVNSRRILDYLFGTIHILKGDIQAVSSTAFIIGPSGVDITGAILTESAKKDKKEGVASTEEGFGSL